MCLNENVLDGITRRERGCGGSLKRLKIVFKSSILLKFDPQITIIGQAQKQTQKEISDISCFRWSSILPRLHVLDCKFFISKIGTNEDEVRSLRLLSMLNGGQKVGSSNLFVSTAFVFKAL